MRRPTKIITNDETESHVED